MTNPPQKTAANYTEKIIDEFVCWIGGELVDTLLPNGLARPLNADYLFLSRTIVAELKCLNKDFFNSNIVQNKATKLYNKWLAEGLIPKEPIQNNITSLPQHLAAELSSIFLPPLKTAVEKANKQIKATKKYFGINDAKGLIILVNEQNSSLIPSLALPLLARIFQNHYSSINSFIYLVPTMDMTAPGIEEPSRAWLSGSTRTHKDGIDSQYMRELQENWIKFLESKLGQSIKVTDFSDNTLVDKLNFVRK